VLAQVVYYFRAAFDVRRTTGAASVRVAVPTGNFGDVLAGFYAMRMGAPISRLILATNANDILARFFRTGVYSLGKVVQTFSPSMDIQVASNFERYLYYRVGSDPARLRELMDGFAKAGSLRVEPSPGGAADPAFLADKASEDECLAAIRNYHERHDYLLDPHTAVGVAVAEKAGLGAMPASFAGMGAARCTDRNGRDDDPIVCLATAHPAKFPEAIRKATGKDIARHPAIDALMRLPTRCKVLPNDKEAVRRFIVEKVG
jgi:threonine synthase